MLSKRSAERDKLKNLLNGQGLTDSYTLDHLSTSELNFLLSLYMKSGIKNLKDLKLTELNNEEKKKLEQLIKKMTISYEQPKARRTARK